MSMFMASIRQMIRDGELRDDGMSSAWLRQMVEEADGPSPGQDGPVGAPGMPSNPIQTKEG